MCSKKVQGIRCTYAMSCAPGISVQLPLRVPFGTDFRAHCDGRRMRGCAGSNGRQSTGENPAA